MGVNLRMPNITAPTQQGQLQQIRSYLYQFSEELQWALATIEKGDATVVNINGKSVTTAPVDSQAQQTPSNFNELKSLIIKSADIVDAMYEEIEVLIEKSGKYTATSDFGTFKQDTETVLYGNGDGTGITQQVTDIQQIFDENGNIVAARLVNGNIFSGILDYAKDGEAIVGIQIGQTTVNERGEQTFNKFARFTADKLEFYNNSTSDDDTPVAYISGYKLYITNAEISGNLKLGGFQLETANGLAFRWVGG